MEKKIPIQVKEIAKKNGCNTIKYIGCYKGKDVYSIYYTRPDGKVPPTGLPTLLMYGEDGNDIVCGFESFAIIDAIENE